MNKNVENKTLPERLRDGANSLAKFMASLSPCGRETEEEMLMREAADEIERLRGDRAAAGNRGQAAAERRR